MLGHLAGRNQDRRYGRIVAMPLKKSRNKPKRMFVSAHDKLWTRRLPVPAITGLSVVGDKVVAFSADAVYAVSPAEKKPCR